ncbi:unnamed protein product [Cunninghamella blakesleeana]
MNFLFLFISSLFFSLIQSQPIKDDHLKIRGNTIHLEKRITSIFPNAGHNTITFTTVHLIAAVIGIVGGLVLLTVIVYIFVKRRRLKQSLHPPPSITIYKKSISSSSSTSSFHPHHQQDKNEPSSILIMPSKIQSPSMSQFETFQSAYYYDEMIKEKPVRHSLIKEDKKSNIAFPPPPYNP